MTRLENLEAESYSNFGRSAHVNPFPNKLGMSDNANLWRDSAQHLFLGLYGVMNISTLVALLLEPPWLPSHGPSHGPDSAKHAMDHRVPYQHR